MTNNTEQNNPHEEYERSIATDCVERALKGGKSVAFTISASVIFSILAQTAAIIWWAASVDSRLSILEEWKNQNNEVLKRVVILEEKVTNVKEQNSRIESKVDALFDHRIRDNTDR